MGDSEFGICDICGVEAYINRKYYRYDIVCECHSPKHFELVYHCNNCEPIEPNVSKIIMKK